jgi:leucyl aminopeptidase (aminopeptidase T)
VLRLADAAEWAEVTSPAGTDVLVGLGLRQVAAGSILQAGEWANVGAEVYTCPTSVDGAWVADGGMGDVFTRYGLRQEAPLRLGIARGAVTAVACADAKLADHFRRYVASDPSGNGARIGEFALATSPELTDLGLVGINMQDEKALTHVACGDPRPELTMAGLIPDRFQWTSPVHVDLTARRTSVTLRGRNSRPVRILEDGRPTAAVFRAMRRHAARLQRRLAQIRAHRQRNDRLPLAAREKLIRLSD